MQTIDRPTKTPARTSPWRIAVLAAAAVAAVPVVLFAIQSKWGVLLLLILAAVTAIALWTWQKKIVFYEMAAFLIHFDGIGLGAVRMGRFVAGFAVAVILYKLVVDRWRPPAVPMRSWVPIWLLLVWATVSGLWAAVSGSFINMVLMFVLGLIYFGVTAILVDSHEAVERFLRAFWVGGLFGSAVGVAGLAVGGRSQGFGGDPNFFGLLLAAMIPLTVYYRRNAPSAKAKYWYTAALLMILAGEAGAGSRSGLIAAAITIVATMVTRPGLTPGRRSRVAVLAVVIGALAFLIGFFSNPTNISRGFADRGAGRLDFLTVTVPLIKEQPLTGYGFGQIRLLIPPNLRVTPGSQVLEERREDVSSHNTWLDTMGDLGLVGLALFVSVFIVTIINLARPRWLELKQLSTTLLVMLLPVFSSSLFLPLLNNKMAWCLIGLSASLQVPSWRSRWRGLAGVEPSGSTDLVAVAPVGTAVGQGPAVGAVPASVGVSGGGPAAAASTAPAPVRLAVWDLRLGRRPRRLILLCVLVGGVLAGGVASTLPTQYSTTVGVLARRLDTSASNEYVNINYGRLQGVLTLAVSGAYAAELQRLSGVDLSVTEVRERMSVARPKSGNMIQITFSGTSEEQAKQVMPYLLPALDNVFADSRAAAIAQTENELRPVVPGEARVYTGPFYNPAYADPVFAVQPVHSSWLMLVGMVSGGLAGVGFVFLGAGRPRVESRDDYPRFTGLRLWTHIGAGGSRRLRATPEQFEQVLRTAADSSRSEREPSRIVVTSPRRDSDTRRLALGMAAALAGEGRRVVLVDAQLQRPSLSGRLARRNARGLADLGSNGIGIVDVMRPVPRWRLPTVPRRLVRRSTDQFRFIAAGTRRSRRARSIPIEWLDQLDPEVAIVVLAPPTMGVVPVSPLLEWGEATVLTMVEGRTTTEDAEDAASIVRLFTHGARGIVLVNA